MRQSTRFALEPDGVYLYFRNKEYVSQIVLQPLIAMLGLYVFVEFVFRTASIVLLNHEMSPSSFPMPTSEYSSLATNRILLEDIAAGRQPAEHAGCQVLAVVDPGQHRQAGKLVYEHCSGIRVIETFAPQQPPASSSARR